MEPLSGHRITATTFLALAMLAARYGLDQHLKRCVRCADEPCDSGKLLAKEAGYPATFPSSPDAGPENLGQPAACAQSRQEPSSEEPASPRVFGVARAEDR